MPIVCFDGGMTNAQKQVAQHAARLQILPLPSTELLLTIQRTFQDAPLLAKQNKRVWPLWICPLLIATAPFRRVFWLDCDIAVLRNLKELFQLLEDGPVFTPENNAPHLTPNRPDLYQLLPISHPFDPTEPRVNAGVSGWDLSRDDEILKAYIYPIERACEDIRVRNAISWHDQGALIWAIQKTRAEHRVVKTIKWNLCALRTTLRDRPVAWNDDFLANVRTMVPEASLVHWNGTRVPWER